MGIFDVNMPLLYGEGDKAYLRLQEEIMKSSEDQSLFAWQTPGLFGPSTGLLSNTPAHFQSSWDIIPLRISKLMMPYSMTNRGLRIELPLLRRGENDIFTAFLGC